MYKNYSSQKKLSGVSRETFHIQSKSTQSVRDLNKQDFNQDNRYRQFFETAIDGVCILNSETGCIEDINRSLLQLFGENKEFYINKKIWNTDLFRTAGLDHKDLTQIRDMKGPYSNNVSITFKKECGKYIELTAEQFVNVEGRSIHFTFRDITHYRRNLILQEEHLKEKNTMLKELQHRAKNTFSVINGLIQLKSFDTESAETKKVLEELSMRVMSISDLYTLLYETDSYHEVDMDSYLRIIGNSITGFDSKITFGYHANQLKLPANKASSVGIILVELIYNAMKYAFPDNQRGNIDICFWKNDDKFTLVVSDNGVGLPKDFSIMENEGSGLNLVRLMAKNLNGDCQVSSRFGTEVIVEFTV